MIKIITGRTMPYNKYIFDDIKDNYRKQYIITFTSLTSFLKWSNKVVRPLLGNKYLAEITEEKWLRDISWALNKLEQFMSHPYIDVIWLPGENKVDPRTTLIDVINLNRTAKSDFIKCIKDDLPLLDKKGLKTLLKRINYRWELYVLYRDILIKHEVTSDTDIIYYVKENATKSANEILQAVVFKERYAIHNYYRLQRKYSKKWVKTYFEEELDNILKAKINLANRKITYKDIRNNKKLSKHYFIISNVPIAHIQILRFLLDMDLGIEIWLKGKPTEIFEQLYKINIDREE